MRTILILFVVTLVDFRAQTKCTCSESNGPFSTNCISCIVQRKDNSGDTKKSKITVRCQTCDIPNSKCSDKQEKFSCAVGSKPKIEEVKIRTKRSMIRVPKIRRELVCTKGKRSINSSCRAMYN
nr:uncharacterized protein LOC112211963 isoform X2 [Halyomorpha halys]